MHLLFGVLGQRGPHLLQQGWWVMPAFGLGSIAAVVGHRLLRRAMGEPKPEPSTRRLRAAIALAVLAYVVTAPFQRASVVLSVALVALFVLRVWRRPSRSAIVFSILFAVVGPLVESLVWRLGLHAYQVQDFLGLPWWLPGIYLHGGLLVAEVEARVSPEDGCAPSGGRTDQ